MAPTGGAALLLHRRSLAATALLLLAPVSAGPVLILSTRGGAVEVDWASFFGLGGLGEPPSKDELTGPGFHGYLERHPISVVLFFAPWDFRSQALEREWDLVRQKLQIHDPPVDAAKINTHRYRDVGDKYDVKAFPTIKLFVDGAVIGYDRAQELKAGDWPQVVKWVNGHLQRDLILNTEQDVSGFLHRSDLAVIGLFPNNDSSLVSHSAPHYDDVMFAEVRSPAADALAKHISTIASVPCETVLVGPSKSDSKTVALPRPDMECDKLPHNPQTPDWSDKFGLAQEGQQLSVSRVDRAGAGWAQPLSFRCCSKPSTAEGPRVPVPSVVMFMPHDERFAVYDGSMTDGKALDQWISARRHPTVVMLSDSTSELVMATLRKGDPVLLHMDSEYDAPGASHGYSLNGELRAAAQSLRGRIMVVASGSSSRRSHELLEISGVAKEELPVLVIIVAAGGKKSAMAQFRFPTLDFTSSLVLAFVDDYFSKRLSPHIRSEPVPASENRLDGHVHVLVGSTYKDFVEDPHHDVVVVVYAPWCGHSRRFEPDYKRTAGRLKHVKSLRFAKIDGSRNELQGVQIAGFPTLLLYPAKPGGRKVMFSGIRSPDAIISWLKWQCAITFDDQAPSEQEVEQEADSGLLGAEEEADL